MAWQRMSRDLSLRSLSCFFVPWVCTIFQFSYPLVILTQHQPDKYVVSFGDHLDRMVANVAHMATCCNISVAVLLTSQVSASHVSATCWTACLARATWAIHACNPVVSGNGGRPEVTPEQPHPIECPASKSTHFRTPPATSAIALES